MSGQTLVGPPPCARQELRRCDEGTAIVVQQRRREFDFVPVPRHYCSSPWVGLHFPPGGAKQTAMLRCCRCPAWFPPETARYEIEAWRVKRLGQPEFVEWRWYPVCLDCYYGGPGDWRENSEWAAFVSRLPSAIRYDQPQRDSDCAAHMAHSGYQTLSKRRRFLEGGEIIEEVVDEDGTVYDVVPAEEPQEQNAESGG